MKKIINSLLVLTLILTTIPKSESMQQIREQQSERMEQGQWERLEYLIFSKNLNDFELAFAADLHLAGKIKSRKQNIYTLINNLTNSAVENNQQYTAQEQERLFDILFWFGKLNMIVKEIERKREQNQKSSERFEKINQRVLEAAEEGILNLDHLKRLFLFNKRNRNCSTNDKFIKLYNRLRGQKAKEAREATEDKPARYARPARKSLANIYVDLEYKRNANRLRSFAANNDHENFCAILDKLPELTLIFNVPKIIETKCTDQTAKEIMFHKYLTIAKRINKGKTCWIRTKRNRLQGYEN